MDQLKDLYLSGVASAKAGNHRLAQAFFKKVVGVDPRHEGAWLWLSEVLEDPDDIAYCLEAVLAINPHNDKARVALQVVRKERQESERPPRPREWSPLAELRDKDLPAILSQTPAPVPPEPVPVYSPLSPRDRDETLRWGLLFFVAVLAVLILSVYLILHQPQSQPQEPLVTPLPTPTAVDLAALHEQERADVQLYLRQFDEIVGPLRLAHDIFRQQSNVRVSLAEQVHHVGQLRRQVQIAREKLARLSPPELLNEAHQEYALALQEEEYALDNLLRFYETSEARYSNRATVQMQEARLRFERAKVIIAMYREWVDVPEATRLPTPTPLYTPTYGPTPTLTPTWRPFPTPTPTPFATRPIG